MCKIKKLTDSEVRKHRKGICITPFCTNRPKPRRKGHKPLRCSACCRRDWAEKNPEKYLYANLRGNARRRGKEFGITLDEFKDFLKKENYLNRLRGRTKFSVSIDREKNSRGYYADNLKAVTLQENSIKRNYVDYFRRIEENYYTAK